MSIMDAIRKIGAAIVVELDRQGAVMDQYAAAAEAEEAAIQAAGGWEWQPAPVQQYAAPAPSYQQYGQYQQPSYIQQQPWFQQPYFAAQVPMEYRQAAFQWQNPFQATHEPVNVIW